MPSKVSNVLLRRVGILSMVEAVLFLSVGLLFAQCPGENMEEIWSTCQRGKIKACMEICIVGGHGADVKINDLLLLGEDVLLRHFLDNGFVS